MTIKEGYKDMEEIRKMRQRINLLHVRQRNLDFTRGRLSNNARWLSLIMITLLGNFLAMIINPTFKPSITSTILVILVGNLVSELLW